MSVAGWVTIVLFAVILTALALPLGRYMANVYTGERVFLTPLLGWLERFLYKLLRVDPRREQDWKSYAKSLLIFSLAGWLLLYLILRTQNAFYVPHALNPLGYHSAPVECDIQHGSRRLRRTPTGSITAARRRTSYLSQMIGLTVQNWLSAGIGIVVAVALIRGITGRAAVSRSATSGRTWCARSCTCWRRCRCSPRSCWSPKAPIQNFSTYLTAHTLTGLTQSIAMGPGCLAGGDQAARHQRRGVL